VAVVQLVPAVGVRTTAGERTELAWERSALAPLAAAALLLVKHLGPTPGRILLVAANRR
jgi:uncharacterized membrane protein YidH (DUF202 family)